MKIEIISATDKVITSLLTMMIEFYTLFNYPINPEQRKALLSEFIGDKSLGRIWIIKSGTVVTGYAVLTFGFSFERDGRDAFVDELYIRPEYRHKGTGRLVLDFIEKEAAGLGVKVMLLEVEPYNEGAFKLYKEKGYTNQGRILMVKKVGG